MVARPMFVCLFAAVISIAVATENSKPDWINKQLKTHPCNRPCNGTSMICHFVHSIEWYYAMSKACYDCPNTIEDCYREDCVQADGVGRPIVVVNRQMPGPSIGVCLGDQIIVDVENMMNDETTSIHWHGHHQVATPYMDGVPFVTQCPISPNSVFRYTMNATNIGTHFWHGHTGFQRGDGVFGSLVVRVPQSQDPHKNLYDKDLSEHIIIVNEWTHVMGVANLYWYLQSTGINYGDTILVNGKGRYYNGSVKVTNTPLAVFNVKKGLKYRFRLINSGVHDCPVELKIDEHTITAIATDGYDIDMVKAETMVSNPGERWDFVVSANMPVANYWMRFTGLVACSVTKAHQVAILHYEGAPEVEPKGLVGYKIHPKSNLVLNPPNVPLRQPGTICTPNLIATNKADDKALQEKPDVKMFLSFDFNAVDHPLYHKPKYYGFNQVNKTYQKHTPQFDHVSFKFPHSPLLTQFKDIDKETFCHNHDLSNCKNNFCECTRIINITSNSVVEIILVDEGVTMDANHPFHLHGYAFRVIGMDRLGTSVTLDHVKQLDKEGKLVRNLKSPPFKDTVPVPDGGYTILRFHATNPGFWLLHCHIEPHFEVGMAVVFKIGEGETFPDAPDGFPKCGDFKNTLKDQGFYRIKRTK